MAAKTQMVTIPLEEYKALLLKEAPTEKSHELCERMLDMLANHIEYDEHDRVYWTSSIGDHMKVKDGSNFVKDLMVMLKYVDFERYMRIWNDVMTGKRNADAMQAKIDQMNEAKEIRDASKRQG